MPITTTPEQASHYNDAEHWAHVMNSLFVPAVQAAHLEPVLPIAHGSHMIHGQIIKNLTRTSIVLVDLSAHNPNVFFEMGVRTSLNLPIALVRDEETELPFDTSGINTHTYDSRLQGWRMVEQIDALKEHLEKSVSSCAGSNPLWRQFGLSIRAEEPATEESPLAAKVDLLSGRVTELTQQIDHERALRDGLPVSDWRDRDRNRDLERNLYGTRIFREGMSDTRSAKAASLFSSALQRWAEPHRRVSVDAVGPGLVEVTTDHEMTEKDLRRVDDLANKYEVAVVGIVVTDSHSS